MSNSVQPHRRQPTRLPRPWDSPGKNTGVGCHFLLQCMKGKGKVKSLSCVRLLVTPWTAAYQAPPSIGFSRQEYWSGVPLPSPAIVYTKPIFFISQMRAQDLSTSSEIKGKKWIFELKQILKLENVNFFFFRSLGVIVWYNFIFIFF